MSRTFHALYRTETDTAVVSCSFCRMWLLTIWSTPGKIQGARLTWGRCSLLGVQPPSFLPAGTGTERAGLYPCRRQGLLCCPEQKGFLASPQGQDMPP